MQKGSESMISTKGRYALRVLIDLAEHRGDRPVPLKEIAERQEISKKYLESIVKDLVRGGFVSGVSGKGGGYSLRKSPEDIDVGDVLELMEGTLAPVACLGSDPYDCQRKGQCQTFPMWEEFDVMVHDFFHSRKLSDLLAD